MKYSYTRELVNELYNINNIQRIDVNLNNIYLSSEIESALPNKVFKIICIEDVCEIDFLVELTTEEKIILDNIVNNHKQNL